MKCKLRKFRLIRVQLHYNYFISFFFCKKNVFYSESIQYVHNFCRTGLFVNVCRGVFRTQSNIYGGTLLRKCQIIFIWITSSSDHKKIWTANLLHTKELCNHYGLMGQVITSYEGDSQFKPSYGQWNLWSK